MVSEEYVSLVFSIKGPGSHCCAERMLAKPDSSKGNVDVEHRGRSTELGVQRPGLTPRLASQELCEFALSFHTQKTEAPTLTPSRERQRDHIHESGVETTNY